MNDRKLVPLIGWSYTSTCSMPLRESAGRIEYLLKLDV